MNNGWLTPSSSPTYPAADGHRPHLTSAAQPALVVRQSKGTETVVGAVAPGCTTVKVASPPSVPSPIAEQ